MGKESQLEQKITNFLARPVQALQQKVTNIFIGIGEALKILFTGWLTNQLFETVKAASEGNKEKLEEIKNTVLKGIGDVVKIFAVIQKGFGLVIRSVTGLAGRIGGLVLKLAKAPLNLIRAGLQTVPGLKTLFPKGPNIRTPSPGGGKGPGIFGAAWAVVESFMNFKNGEYVDAVLPIVATFGPGKFIKALFAAGFLADNIAEVFKTNIFGKDPNREKEEKMLFEEEKQKREKKPPASTSKTAAKVEPVAKAQTSLMGDKKDGVEANVSPGPIPGSAEIKPTSDSTATASNPKTSMMPETKKPDTASTPKTSLVTDIKTAEPKSTSTPQTSMMGKTTTAALPPPSPEMEKNFQMAWDNRNFGLARGRIDTSWNNMSIEQQQQAKVWAQSKGYDWNEMKLTEKSPVVPAEVTAAKMQPLSKSSQNVGELAEPKTSIIMAPAAQNQPQKSSSPSLPTNGTNVPLISSSNPDNFYVLYSQLNYNVVV
jgi:hypothetical protein